MTKFFTLLALTLTFTLFSKNKSWTCIKEDGSTAFTLDAKYVYDFHDGLAKVKVSSIINNKWVYNMGFVDTKGNLVVTPKYDDVKGKGFTNGRAWVKKHDSDYWTLIDKTGKEIPTNQYKKVGYIYENNNGLMAVYNDKGEMGFINSEGKEVIPCKYLGASFFSQGLACVMPYDGKEANYGFINTKGEVVIPFQFKQAGVSTFMDNGWCRAVVNGLTVLINKEGEVVFKTSKGNIQGMSNGWVRVFKGKMRDDWGYINLKDEWVIDPVYDDLKEFNSVGLAAAQKDGLWGVIDTTSKVVVPFKYETIYAETKDGMILGAYPTTEPTSLLKTPKDYYTLKGEAIKLPANISYVYPADGQQITPFIDQNGNKGYVNLNFEIVIPANYKKAEPFSEGLAWVLAE